MADIGIHVVILGVAEARRNVGAVQGDINNLEKTIRGVSGTSQQFGQDITRVGSALMGFGRTLTIAVTAPIVAAGVALTEAGIQFESTFAGIGKTVEGVMTPMGQLTEVGERVREEFRQMALEVPVATNELNRLGETVGQLGIQADDIAEVTELVAMLGATTELSAEEAAMGLIRFGNIMGVTTDKFEDFIRRAGSALVALGNTSVSTEGEILNLSLRLSAAGDRANFSAQEIMAWATTLSDLGVRAEMGGTAVSRAITEMLFAVQSGSENISTFATVTRQSVAEFSHAFEEDASAALLNFITNLEAGIRTGRVTEDMLRDMGLSGVRAIDVMGRLGDASGIFERNLATANTEWERQLALQEEFNKRAATVESQIQILKNQFTDLGITVFDLVRDDLVRLIEFIGDLIDKFKALDPATQKTLLIIAGIAAAVGPLLIILGAAIAAIGTMITAIAAIATPVGIAVVAVSALGAALAATFGPQLIGAIQAAAKELSAFFGMDRMAAPEIRVGGIIPTGPAEGGPVGGAAREGRGTTQAPSGFVAPLPPTGFEQLLADIQSIVAEVTESLRGFFDLAKQTISDFFSSPEVIGTIEFFRGLFETARVVIEEFAIRIGELLGPSFTELFTNINALLNALGLDWETVWEAIKTATVIVVGVIIALIIGIAFVIAGLVAIFASSINAIVGTLNFLLTAGSGILDSLGMVFEGLVRIVGGVMAEIQGIITGDWALIEAGWSATIQGIVEVTAGFAATVLNLILFLAGAVMVAVSELAAGIAHFLGFEGAVTALHEFTSEVTRIVSELTQGIIDLFQALFYAIIGGSIIPDMVSGILGAITGLKDQFLGLIDTLVTDVIGKLTDLAGKAAEIFQNITGGGAETVATVAPAIDEAAIARLQQALLQLQQAVTLTAQLFTTILITPAITQLATLATAFVNVTTIMLISFSTALIAMQQEWAIFSEFVSVGTSTLLALITESWMNFQIVITSVLVKITADFQHMTQEILHYLGQINHNFNITGLHALEIADMIKGAMFQTKGAIEITAAAFKELGIVALETAGRVAQAAGIITTSMGNLQSAITGSPELKIQHPFETFQEFLKNANFSVALGVNDPFGILPALSAVPAGATTSNVSNVDRSVNVDGINLTKNEQGMMYELLYSRQQARNR